MHNYLLLTTLLLISCHAFATCVVIVRTDREIIIGADSRRVLSKSDGTFKGEVQDGYCKIRQAGRFYYAFVGYNDIKQKEFAELAAKSAKNMQDFVKIFYDNLAQFYADNLAYIRANNPDSYARNFTGERGLIAEMPFFCFEAGSPQVIVLRFYNTAIGNQPVNIRAMFSSNQPFYILGYTRKFDNAYPTSDSIDEEIKQVGPVDLIKKAINLEAQAHPDIVGGPVYILKLSATRKEWVDGIEPEC